MTQRGMTLTAVKISRWSCVGIIVHVSRGLVSSTFDYVIQVRRSSSQDVAVDFLSCLSADETKHIAMSQILIERDNYMDRKKQSSAKTQS